MSLEEREVAGREPARITGSQTAARALRILRGFLDGSPEKSLLDIAQAQQLHKTIVHRLLATLAEQGFVVRDPVTRRYRLGLTAIALGEAARSVIDVRREALPFMKELVRQTGETTFLTLLSQDEAVCVELVESTSPMKVTYRVGFRHPLHAGAPGKVMLAYLGDDFVDRLTLRPFTERTVTDAAQLRRELSEIRSQGYSYSVGELEPEVSGLAVPILSQGGLLAAGLGLVGPKHRFQGSRLAEVVSLAMEAGLEISKRLGYQRR